MYEELDEFNQLKSQIVIEFKKSYNRLLETIKKYKFRENSSKGFAAKQNRNSRIIVTDLQILNRILDSTLQYIDTFILQSGPTEDLNKIIHYLLNQYINGMNSTDTLLNDAMYEYYDDSKSIVKKNSAVRARDWKKERNSALSYVLHISIGLLDIKNSLRLYINDYDSKFINEYQEFIEYLTSRPNYYSYFTADEQLEETKNNKERKRKLKLNDRLKLKQQN